MSRATYCVDCNAATTNPHDNYWRRVTLANRGGRVAYLCPTCACKRADYDADNLAPARGTSTNSGLTYGVEFEVNAPDATFRAQMQAYDLLPSSDCTVGLEFKSPVYRSLNPLKGFLRTVDRLINDGHASVGDNCGTHAHVGHARYINHSALHAIAANYARLFGPLSDAMLADPLGCARLFGRPLAPRGESWAHAIDEGSNPYNHSNFINIEHARTLEWRICKFVSAAQYMRALHACKAFTNCLINNYIAYALNGADSATLRHKADVTGAKLVKLYKKHALAALQA